MKLISDALAVTNEKLELKTRELNETNKALFESHHKLAEINNELASANKRLALTNKRLIEVTRKLTHSNKELRLVNQRTKEYDSLNAELINKAAHEIRTPIHNILGYSELLLMELENDTTNSHPASKNQSIQAIFRNANRLQMLTEGILNIARIERKTLKLNKKQINLIAEMHGFIEHIIRSEISTNNKKIEILFQPEEEYITIEADNVLLQGIIHNLLDSSIKLVKDDETICVDIKRFYDEIDISIKLAVTGVDPRILPSLFTKFEYKSYQGLGLSLFIAKTIVEAHGGRIWVENAPNSNAVLFTFSLPVNHS
ncbi:MAG TPA: ATP-binding protein [Nitrososphaeraceae archaeon]|nr:ATP-binding protein [Nitrososphaeraceae archaeon]